MSSISVRMPWQPGLTAGNAYRVVGRKMRITKEARAWRDAAAFLLRQELRRANFREAMVIEAIRVRSDWYSPQEPDQDNRMKLVLDALQMATGINDKNFTIEPGTWQRTKGQDAHIDIIAEWE